MFSTSHDILNLVLSVCIVAFTVFLCWFMYYMISSFRSIYKLIKSIGDVVQKVSGLANTLEEKIESGARIVTNFGDKINDVFSAIKEKLSHSSSYLMIIGEVLKRIFDFMQEKKERGTMGSSGGTRKKNL